MRTTLIVPGLGDSGPGHWQTWMETRLHDCARVSQDDWDDTNLEAWAMRVAEAIDHCAAPPVLVAHSFGCLAAVRACSLSSRRIAAALLVAPADPNAVGRLQAMPLLPLPFPSVLVASRSDPWLSYAEAARWAGLWRSRLVDLGDVGHINTESGFGPWPEGLSLLHDLRAWTSRRSFATAR